MSRATADIMRRALQFCCQGFSQKHHLTPATGSSKLYSVHCGHLPTPKTAFCFHFRLFSDAQTHSTHQESEKESLASAAVLSLSWIPKSQLVFLDDLNLCSSPSDVLDMTSHSVLSVSQLSSCLSRMWNISKKLTEEQRQIELLLMREHAEWERLLQRMEGGVIELSNLSLAYSLHALLRLGVDPKSRVVQTHLRVAQERMNIFNEKSLSIMALCLENMEAAANVQALKHGFRLLVEAHLPMIDNVQTLQKMMRLVGKDAPLQLKHKLESKALSMSDQFSLPNALYMFSSMAALGFCSEPLLLVCSNLVIEHLSAIPFNRLLTVLMSCRELRFKDLQLLNAVSEHGASMVHVWNRKQLILLLHTLESLSFRPQSLLDSFSELVQSDPGALTLENLLAVLRVCSSLNYHSPSLVSCLSSALEQYLQWMTPQQLLKAQYCMSVMGHFPPALFRALLQERTNQWLRKSEPLFVQRQLEIVELCLGLERPELYKTFSVFFALSLSPPEAPPVPSSKAEFCSALQTLMEDREDWDVTEGHLLERCHYIDAILTKKTSNGDLGRTSAETSCQRVAVLSVSDSAFCYGTSHPRGPLALKLRHLRILGYLPLLVPEKEILPLSEEQRVDFLRALIFPKDRNISAVTQELLPLET